MRSQSARTTPPGWRSILACSKRARPPRHWAGPPNPVKSPRPPPSSAHRMPAMSMARCCPRRAVNAQLPFKATALDDLEVQHQVAYGSRRADQHRTRSWRLQRCLDVFGGAGDDSGFTHVADTASAREAGRYVTRFREIQDAAVVRGPIQVEPAAGKGDRRAGPRWSGRKVRRRAERPVNDARVDR